jgi:hypothetical protein
MYSFPEQFYRGIALYLASVLKKNVYKYESLAKDFEIRFVYSVRLVERQGNRQKAFKL